MSLVYIKSKPLSLADYSYSISSNHREHGAGDKDEQMIIESDFFLALGSLGY